MSESNNLQELNKKVHDLNYADIGQKSKIDVKPDVKRGLELARKIKENLQAYKNETDLSQ
jgi:hypothetical protein